MKVVVQTDFLCSYYWHAASAAEEQITNHTLPESLYFAITAVVLWQCILEAYINFLIEKHGQAAYRFQRSTTKQVRLKEASIKEKWLHLPLAVAGVPFTVKGEPFISFAKLVDMRNALVHFDSDKLCFEKDAPKGTKTVGDLNHPSSSPATCFPQGEGQGERASTGVRSIVRSAIAIVDDKHATNFGGARRHRSAADQPDRCDGAGCFKDSHRVGTLRHRRSGADRYRQHKLFIG